jgi:hypothetical protein
MLLGAELTWSKPLVVVALLVVVVVVAMDALMSLPLGWSRS